MIETLRTSGHRIILVLILLSVVALRFRLIDVPLERDEGEYAYMAQLLLQGIPPYTEAYSMKFPGIYFIYALIIMLLGQTHTAIHTALLLVNLLTIGLVYLIATHIGGRLVGLASALCFALMSMSYRVEGLWANTEHFVLPFFLSGLLFLVRDPKTTSLWPLVGAGLLLSTATLVKQHGAILSGFGLLYALALVWKSKNSARSRQFQKTAVLLCSCATPVLLMMVYLMNTGAFPSFFFWTIQYASVYATQVPWSDAPQYFWGSFQPQLRSMLLLWLLAAGGCIAVLADSQWRQRRWLLAGLFAASLLAVAPGFFFRPHYFLFLLPAVSILAGIGFSSFVQMLSPVRFPLVSRGLPTLVASAAIVGTIGSHADVLFSYPPDKVARVAYGGNPFPESIHLAQFLRERTSDADRIGILGSEPQLLFYSRRRAASKYIYMYPMMEHHAFARSMQEEKIAQIEAAQPRLLVVVNMTPSWLRQPQSETLLFQWFDSYVANHYTHLARMEINAAENKHRFFLRDGIVHPPSTRYWIDVFERRTP